MKGENTMNRQQTTEIRKEPRQGYDAGRTIRRNAGIKLTSYLFTLHRDGKRVVHDLVEQFGPGVVLAFLRSELANLAIEAEQIDHPKADLFRQLRCIVGQAYKDTTAKTQEVYEGRE